MPNSCPLLDCIIDEYCSNFHLAFHSPNSLLFVSLQPPRVLQDGVRTVGSVESLAEGRIAGTLSLSLNILSRSMIFWLECPASEHVSDEVFFRFLQMNDLG